MRKIAEMRQWSNVYLSNVFECGEKLPGWITHEKKHNREYGFNIKLKQMQRRNKSFWKPTKEGTKTSLFSWKKRVALLFDEMCKDR